MIAAIAAAAQEQMQGIGRVNQAVTQMDEMTQKNALLAEQIVESTTTMQHHAQQTEQWIGFFTSLGWWFVAKIAGLVSQARLPVPAGGCSGF